MAGPGAGHVSGLEVEAVLHGEAGVRTADDHLKDGGTGLDPGDGRVAVDWEEGGAVLEQALEQGLHRDQGSSRGYGHAGFDVG